MPVAELVCVCVLQIRTVIYRNGWILLYPNIRSILNFQIFDEMIDKFLLNLSNKVSFLLYIYSDISLNDFIDINLQGIRLGIGKYHRISVSPAC